MKIHERTDEHQHCLLRFEKLARTIADHDYHSVLNRNFFDNGLEFFQNVIE